MKQEQHVTSAGADACINMGIFTDRQGRIDEANKVFAETFGSKPAALRGQGIGELLHGDVPTVVLAEILQSMRQRRVWIGALKFSGEHDGRWLQVTVAPVAGQNGRFIWTFVAADNATIAATQKRYSRLSSGKEKVKKNLFGKLRERVLNLPIGLKIGGFTVLLSTLLASFLIIEGLSTITTVLDDDEHRLLSRYSGIVDTSVDNLGSRAASLATLVASLPETAEAMRNRDKELLLTMFSQAFANLKKNFGIQQFQFHVRPAASLLRLHKPEKSGDDLSGFRKTVVEANASGEVITGLEKGRAGYGIRGVVPIIDEGEFLGSVEFGTSFGQKFFDSFKEKYGVEVGFFELQDGSLSLIASTFAQQPTLSDEALSRIMAGQLVTDNMMLAGVPTGVLYRQFNDYSGKPIGVLAVGQDRTSYIDTLSAIRYQKLTIAVIVVLLSALLSYLVARNYSAH